MPMAVMNAEQLQIQETSCGEYIKIHKVLSVALSPKQDKHPLCQLKKVAAHSSKLRSSPHFK